MTQYGAYGMALNGYSAPEILAHYYTGTTVEEFSSTSASSFLANDSDPLWVGLMQNQTSIEFTISGGPARLCQGWGIDSFCLDANGGQKWRYKTNADGMCVFERVSAANPLEGEARDCDGSIRPADGTTIRMGPEGYAYSWGVFRLREVPASNPARFHVSLETAIEPYIKGIHEVFAAWPSNALKAQAIASRSYVLANASSRGPQSSFSSNVKASCWCHLYDDSRSQVFKGDYMYAFPKWQDAVEATTGDVVAHGGTLVTAYYSSSSGGKTENSEDVWSSSRPWLKSVDDSWAHLPEVGNPMSSWTRVRSRSVIKSNLGLGLDKLDWIKVSHRPSGGTATVVFGGRLDDGQSTTVERSGTWVASRLGLPSHYFSVEGIASGPSAPPPPEEPEQPEPEAPKSAYDITWDKYTAIGWIDGVTDTGEGSLRVRGWTLDPDTDLPLIVHIYIDGKFAKGLWADDRRPDVGRVHNMGERHGFDVTVETSDGSHSVCVYALNAPTKKGNPQLGCKTTKVTSPAQASPTPQPSGSAPFGWIDSISISNGALHTRGWAIDKDAADASVPIHIYVDGSFFLGGPANQYRPDVERVHGLGAHHGFEFSKSIQGGSHKVCLYAINLPEKTNNPLLGCKTVSG